MQKITLVILGAVLILVGAWVLLRAGPDTNGPLTPNGGETPVVFSSSEYGFSLTLPSDWRVSTSSLPDLTPAVNALPMPPEGVPPPPYIHHDNVTNVSVFPNGVPTEGLFADRMPLDFDPGFNATNTIMFVLEDGTPFAAYLQPAELPQGWGEAGFVWIRVYLRNATTACLDAAGQKLTEERCDPLTEDHRIIWNGERASGEWEEALGVLRSLEFDQ